MSKKTWKRIAVGALLLGLGGCVLLQGGKAAQLRKEYEAARAREAGLIVAKEESEKTLKAKVGQLQEQITKLKDVVPDVEIREVTKWRTNPMNLDLQRERDVLLDRMEELRGEIREINATRPEGCPECPEPPALEDLLPDLQVDARGTDARLKSRAGNTFAVGTVEIWNLNPERKIASADWNADITELLKRKEEGVNWRANVRLGLQPNGIDFGLSFQRMRRLNWYVGAQYDFDPEELTRYSDCTYGQACETVSSFADRVRISGGLEYTIGRR